MQRLRPLSEEECYLRCYGQRGADDTVKLVETEPIRSPGEPSVLAERMRLQLEAAIDAREREAA
jgi:hypothetical protein